MSKEQTPLQKIQYAVISAAAEKEVLLLAPDALDHLNEEQRKIGMAYITLGYIAGQRAVTRRLEKRGFFRLLFKGR